MRKSLADISWQVSEPEYRQDPALSYSTLAKYEREGFEHLDTLFKRVESPSLLFGSCVDTLLTDGEKAFEDQYYISDIPKVKASAEPVVKQLYDEFHNSYTNINDIPDSDMMPVISQNGYMANTNWGTVAKCKSIRTEGAAYYQTMFMAGDKTIVPQDMYNRIFACVRALKDSPRTKMYFKEDDPFDGIERCYQMKFKGVLDGKPFRGMSDLLICNHNTKTVIPCDLKTSHNREYNFPMSFLEFRYDIQARLYWKLIRQLMDKDEYFKDFTLEPFRFIVVNNFDKPLPLVWIFRQTMAEGTIELGGRKLRNPVVIGKELYYYLENNSEYPLNISLNQPNSIDNWFEDRK